MTQRNRSWVFTINNYNDDDEQKLLGLGCGIDEAIRYLCFGREVAPSTGTRHLQGYISFASARSFSSVKSVLGESAHIEVARGNAKQNKEYCSKGGDFTERGDPPNPGKRNDLGEIRQLLQSGAPISEVAEVCSSAQAFNFALRAAPFLRPAPQRGQPTVKWFHGGPGLGKSRRAFYLCDEVGVVPYVHSSGRWFDGYDQHAFAIFDDLRPTDFSFSFLLRLLDRYPLRVEFKGGSTQWVPTTIFITSCLSPTAFTPQGEDCRQLLRRITEVEEFVEEWVPPQTEVDIELDNLEQNGSATAPWIID